ncbi:hypothetical protein HC256_008418 [Beauveria bassiana]|nr:hypothetical protein HC256_008418 [Beauveria bassiana]
MASLENESLGSAGGGRVDFGHDKVHDHERNQKGKEDSKISPDMRVVVLVARVDEGIATDRLGALDGTSDGADKGSTDTRLVWRNKRAWTTGKIATMEFIGDEDLKGVKDGIDPSEPGEPRMHGRLRNNETGINDEDQDHDTRQTHGLLATKSSHKVEDNVEDDRSDELDWYIRQDAGHGLGSGMIKGIRGLLLDNGPLGVETVDFGNGREGVHENRDKEHRAARKEAIRGGGVPVKGASHNESDEDVAGDLGRLGGNVAPDALVGAAGVCLDLHPGADEVGRLGTDVAGLHGVFALAQLRHAVLLVAAAKLAIVRVNLGEQRAAVRRLQPGLFKVLGRARHLVFEALPRLPLARVGDGGEKVARRLPRRAVPAHVLKVALGLARGAKVDLPALVQHRRLVKQVVDGLARLVNGHGAHGVANLRHRPQALHKLERRGRVEAARAIVPRANRRARQQHLGDAHAFALAARHAAHKVVADFGVVRVAQPKRRHDHLDHVLCVLLARHALDALLRRPHRRRKLERLPDRQMRKVLVHFLVVRRLALELGHHLLLRDAAVVNLSLVAQLEAVQLAANGLEHGAAPGPGPPEYHEQLPGLEDAVEAVQDLLVLLLAKVERLAEPQRRHQQRAHRLLDLHRVARAKHVQVAPRHARVGAHAVLLAHLAHKVAHPLAEIEAVALRIEPRVVPIEPDAAAALLRRHLLQAGHARPPPADLARDAHNLLAVVVGNHGLGVAPAERRHPVVALILFRVFELDWLFYILARVNLVGGRAGLLLLLLGLVLERRRHIEGWLNGVVVVIGRHLADLTKMLSREC